MSNIEESEQFSLEYGDYPALEALAFTAIEMRKFGQRREDIDEDDMSLASSYITKSAFF